MIHFLKLAAQQEDLTSKHFSLLNDKDLYLLISDLYMEELQGWRRRRIENSLLLIINTQNYATMLTGSLKIRDHNPQC